MADTKITGLTALAEAPNASDLLVLVDVSDTTMDAAGTTKKITYANLTSGLGGGGAVVTETADFTLDATTHPNGSTIVVDPAAGTSTRIIKLMTIANQPAAGYRVRAYLTTEGGLSIGNNADTAAVSTSFSGLFAEAVYLGSDKWMILVQITGNGSPGSFYCDTITNEDAA